MGVERQHFGDAPDGRTVWCFVLRDDSGCKARVLSWGAILASLRVPDASGTPGEVVLGFDGLEGYLGAHPYFGAIVGRYANRIASGRFVLDGREIELARNEAPHHLHGGERGFDKAHWEAEPLDGPGEAVRLRLSSPDGDEGYPGRLEVTVDYRLAGRGELRIDYRATTDRPTVVNLTNHSYFNLRDSGASDILGHELWLDADRYTPTDAAGIPTGELAAVKGTALDFSAPRALGERIEELRGARGGYDHNYLANAPPGELATVARLRDSESGRALSVRTTQPGLQLYTANHLDGSLRGHGGVAYERWHAVCLETQHFPDSPNRPDFPSTVLRPGEEYRQTTVYAFSAG